MRLISTLLVAFLFSGSAMAESVEKSLNDFNDQFNAHAADHSADGLMSLYTEDALLIGPGAAPAPASMAARGIFEFLAAQKGVLYHTVDQYYVSNDESMAVIIGEGGGEAGGMKFKGTYLFVMKRVGDEWKVVTDMYNQHKPQEEAAAQ